MSLKVSPPHIQLKHVPKYYEKLEHTRLIANHKFAFLFFKQLQDKIFFVNQFA